MKKIYISHLSEHLAEELEEEFYLNCLKLYRRKWNPISVPETPG